MTDLIWMPEGSWTASKAQRHLSAVIAALPESLLPYVAEACLQVVYSTVGDDRFTPEERTAIQGLGRAVDEVFGRDPGTDLP